MNIGFLMYAWERIDPRFDSTLRLLHECARRGHRVAVTHPGSLQVHHHVPSANCRVVVSSSTPDAAPEAFHANLRFSEQQLPLSEFDALLIRLPPPLDSEVLGFLDAVQHKVFLLNSIEGLRRAESKLYPLTLSAASQAFLPATHVLNDRSELKRIIEGMNGRVVLKPLRGLAGNGVSVVDAEDPENLDTVLRRYTDGRFGSESDYVMVQEYVESPEPGDVRILLLDGEPLGAMRRRPPEGGFRSNLHAGGEARPHTLTSTEQRLCQQLGPELVADGLDFVGLDVIVDKLLEVNVCSPGGLTRINRFNNVRLQASVIDFVETRVQARTPQTHAEEANA